MRIWSGALKFVGGLAMGVSGLMLQAETSLHAVVMPLFGDVSADFGSYLQGLVDLGFFVVLVDNNPEPLVHRPCSARHCELVFNGNRGGIAGGLNQGILRAVAAECTWITLLDQDSRIPVEQISLLQHAWDADPGRLLVVGPCIWDAQRQERHGRWRASVDGFDSTRLLISSGTTFRSSDWPLLGSLHEGLFIDFVDHAWCFRAQARGFQLLQHPKVRLSQQFGVQHPNRFCRRLGLQLYGPERHFYGLRNLRWLCVQSYIPLDLKTKELLKMLVKPWLWLLFEPRRLENLRAIVAGLFASLPADY
ncbi:MAG: glycosyltransferase [Cyanobium sp.]